MKPILTVAERRQRERESQHSRSRSREIRTRGAEKKTRQKPRRIDTKVREPAQIDQDKLKLGNYLPLTQEMLDLKGRWMALEDLNIWMYVKEFGASHHKRHEFWEQGYENYLWRQSKTVSSLRNRERFYVCHLNNEDIQKIKTHVRGNPNKPCYCNFQGLGADIRKMVSISNYSPEETITALGENAM